MLDEGERHYVICQKEKKINRTNRRKGKSNDIQDDEKCMIDRRSSLRSLSDVT